MQRVDWEALWSTEARKKALPSLHGERMQSCSGCPPHTQSCSSDVSYSMHTCPDGLLPLQCHQSIQCTHA